MKELLLSLIILNLIILGAFITAYLADSRVRRNRELRRINAMLTEFAELQTEDLRLWNEAQKTMQVNHNAQLREMRGASPIMSHVEWPAWAQVARNDAASHVDTKAQNKNAI